MPRRNRSTPENNIDLNLTYERTLGSLGGIRAEGSAEADLGSALSLKNNRLSGGIDFAERTANLNTEIGLGKKLSGSLEGSVKLNERGGVESIGGGIGVSIAGFGGGLSADSQGNAAISAEAFGGKVEVARDSSGAVTVQICYGIGIAEFCTTFSRDKGDPQNEGSLKLGGGIKPSTGGMRPQKPKAPTESPKRPPARSRTQPERPPRPKSEPVDKPKEDKQPNLIPRRTKKTPIDIRKKPPIDLRKKPPIDLKKKPPKPPKKLPKPPRPKIPRPPKTPGPNPEPPAPINLKKPVPAPTPNPTKPPRPTPVPKPPRPPRPTPSPQPPKPIPVPRPNPWLREPPPNPSDRGITYPIRNLIDLINPVLCYDCLIFNRNFSSAKFEWATPFKFLSPSLDSDNAGAGNYSSAGNHSWNTILSDWSFRQLSPAFVKEHTPVNNASDRQGGGHKVNYKAFASLDGGLCLMTTPSGYIYFEQVATAGKQIGTGNEIKFYLQNYAPPPTVAVWEISLIEIPCRGSNPNLPRKIAPLIPPPPKYNSPRLPNKPTKPTKPMDKNCCKKVDEIYKYLGIAKLKKNKFPVAKTFLAPGGTGNEDCEDYYQLNQALFRMLANGLILNPVASPHGNTWQTVNATAWAGQVYEMVAEAMSNGDSTQKFEITMAMQVTQLLTIIAEQTRKIEFLGEVIGIAPDFDIEEVPACFTIYEGHKGFGEKQSKKIDITKAKTDTEVEEVLGKMLKPSKIPITKWVMREGTRSIVKIITEG